MKKLRVSTGINLCSYPKDDIFEFNSDKQESEISMEIQLSEKDIPQDNLFNKFVNWFRKQY